MARRFLIALSAFLAAASTLPGQATLWREIDEKAMLDRAAQASDVEVRRNIVPQTYRAVELDRTALDQVLASAPAEFSGPIDANSAELEMPMPDGGFVRFNVQESPIMEPGLAEKFPEIKTYVGQGIDDPAATMRIDVTPQGFHAIILSPKGDIFVDPYWRENDAACVVYRKRDYLADEPFACLVDVPNKSKEPRTESAGMSKPSGALLRKYRLALACTGEYATAVSAPNPASINATLAAMITSVNRVNAVYEREFAIRLILVNNSEQLIYLTGSSDPYSNGNGGAMLSQNQSTIDNVIGSANYDIGHVFSTGGGGVAYLGIVCVGGYKAGGVTGRPTPRGDPFDIDYVAHEMGHQFGGNHSFNSTVNQCGGGNRNGARAYEVGSGTSIMAYAGICGATNLAPNSDDYFHTGSYTEIDNNVTSGNSTCAVTAATGNNPPVIAALSPFTIPANTPFALTGSATDANSDFLTYCWEEHDLGAAQSTTNPVDNSSNPLFRSFAPTPSPTRYFPSLKYILENANVAPESYKIGNTDYATGEVLPSIARTMNFRLTVRDNHAGAGGVDWAATTITTVATGAAFAITSPNTATTFPGGSHQTINWEVAGSNANGINCAAVKISLSTDGGYTFPTVLVSSAPNNGSALVTLPDVATSQGRIKVEAIGNIFFDISDANFTIISNNNAPVLNITGSVTAPRGQSTASFATIGSVSDADGDALSIAVSDVPYGMIITPSISNGSISVGASVHCSVVTTNTSRAYPFTLIVTDAKGATTSATASIVVTLNTVPTIGSYPNITVARTGTGFSGPSVAAADVNGNLNLPYSVSPTTLPGGGAISVDPSTGIVTVTAVAGSTLTTTTIYVTATDSCGAAVVSSFSVTVVPANANFTSAAPPSPLVVGMPYSHTFSATGAPAPTFSLTSGTLPPGLTLSPSGVLSGTPTSAGTGTFTNITVTASNGKAPDAEQTFSLAVVTRAPNYLAGYGLSGNDAALLYDFDRDGLTNLMEYALRLDPTVAASGVAPAVVLKDYGGMKFLSITFTRSSVATDLTYLVQGSSDLVGWSDLAISSGGNPMTGAGLISETGAAPSFTDEVRDTVPYPSGPRYLRLKVTTP